MHLLIAFAPVIIVIWIMLIGIRISAHMEKKYRESNPVIPEKACPPHKWRWEEQPGMENTCFIRCQRCMRMPRQVSEGP